MAEQTKPTFDELVSMDSETLAIALETAWAERDRLREQFETYKTERLLKAIVAADPDDPTTTDYAELEAENARLKAHLAAIREVRSQEYHADHLRRIKAAIDNPPGDKT